MGGFFFGLYSGIFAMYLQHHGSQKSTDKAKNILFYALWALYALSVATTVIDISQMSWPDVNLKILDHLRIIEVTMFACSDFIVQFILIYRCWIMWGYRIRVVIAPSFLAFAFLAIWIVGGTAPMIIVQGIVVNPGLWSVILALTGVTLSMTEVKTCTAADDQILGVTSGNTLRRVMFILIESGTALFLIQLARLVVTIVNADAAYDALRLIAAIHQMLSGITPTIILVRVSMGLSFHDESSMVEASIGNLAFMPDISNSISGNEIVNEERRHDDFEIQ